MENTLANIKKTAEEILETMDTIDMNENASKDVQDYLKEQIYCAAIDITNIVDALTEKMEQSIIAFNKCINKKGVK